MQSDFTDSPTTPLDDPFAQHNSLEQHGFHSSNNIHGLSRDSSDERSERSASSYNNQPLEGQGISPDKMEYLYHTDEQPRVLTDRVTQYENALQQLPKAAHKSKGPAFVVVPSPDGECSENVVENLPNGMQDAPHSQDII